MGNQSFLSYLYIYIKQKSFCKPSCCIEWHLLLTNLWTASWSGISSWLIGDVIHIFFVYYLSLFPPCFHLSLVRPLSFKVVRALICNLVWLCFEVTVVRASELAISSSSLFLTHQTIVSISTRLFSWDLQNQIKLR